MSKKQKSSRNYCNSIVDLLFFERNLEQNSHCVLEVEAYKSLKSLSSIFAESLLPNDFLDFFTLIGAQLVILNIIKLNAVDMLK